MFSNLWKKLTKRREAQILVSSDPANGAQNISSNGDAFSMSLQDSLKIPSNAENVKVKVDSAEIWWTVPNVITNSNDQFQVISSGAGATPAAVGNYTVTVGQGLYGRPEYNNAVVTQLVNAGAEADLILIGENASTGKVQITTAYTGVSIEFRDVQLPRNNRTMLGWNDQLLGPSASAPFTWIADNVAQFNTVNSFLLHSDMCGSGMPLNGSYSQIVANIQINVNPGSQILYTPFNPPNIDASSLVNSKRRNFRFWITDESNNSINTGGEYWGARFVITWELPND